MPYAYGTSDCHEHAAGSSLDSAAAKAGIHTAVAVLRYLQHAPWLAKDIIWVIPDVACGTLYAMQARQTCQDSGLQPQYVNNSA